MGKKDASATRLPVDQYRKQIGKFLFTLELVNEFVDQYNVIHCNQITWQYLVSFINVCSKSWTRAYFQEMYNYLIPIS